MPSQPGAAAYRAGVAAAIAVSIVQVCMNRGLGIIGNEDNPTNQSFYFVVVTALACAFAAGFRTAGMARAMVATAAVHSMIALLIATEPINARNATLILGVSTVFGALWLASAALFWRSARQAA